jgi:malonate transporter and related proteins
MLQTLAVTGPIYFGFLGGRSRIFSKLDMRVLDTYVVKFALPALVFTALSQRPVGEVMNPQPGYAVGSLVVMMTAFGWAWRWLGKSSRW